MQSNKRIITVFGATGNQGCSVVEALLKDGTMAIRGITRKPSGPEGKDLTKRGVQVRECDITGPVEGLVECMKGSYGVFLMTNPSDPSQTNREIELGKKLVDAARMAGVKHVIWSTLPHVNKLSNGKYNLPPFSDKAEVEEYIRQLQTQSPKAFEHATFVAPSFFYQNFDAMAKQEGDTWVFTMPKCKSIVAFDVDEIGASIVTCLKNPAKYELKRIDYYGEMAPLENFIRIYEKVNGRKTRLDALSMEEYTKLNTPGAKVMVPMFGWFNDFGFYGNTGDTKSGQEATPGGLSTYETYLRNKKQISS